MAESPGTPGHPAPPEGLRVVTEEVRAIEAVEWYSHPEWEERFPWLVQGTTSRGGAEPFDLQLLGSAAPNRVHERWVLVRRVLRMPRVVHARQVHGRVVRFHSEGPEGLHASVDVDGHVTRSRGVLLTVSVADCVPITLVDPSHRAVAVLHGGWRGVAAGILEEGVGVMAERLATRPADLRVHLGPAICGACYEVGPEVHDALGLDTPTGPTPVDLRAVLAARAVGAGVLPHHVTVSAHCTRDTASPFFSHRGGETERQVGFAGVAL